jgi:hypothetical protein
LGAAGGGEIDRDSRLIRMGRGGDQAEYCGNTERNHLSRDDTIRAEFAKAGIVLLNWKMKRQL